MKTATLIKKLKWVGDARLYRLGEDGNTTGHVVVSAAVAMFTGPETYIFASDADGNVTDWCELDGSFRGGLDHGQALRNAGYVDGDEHASETQDE